MHVAYADILADDYLWLEFDEEIKNTDGNIIQSLFLYYGQFPYKKGSIQKLDKMEAFYTFGEKNKKGEDIFYKLEIEKEKVKSYIKVRSKKENWCMVLVRGNGKSNVSEYNYLAKTSFFLFGHADDTEQESAIGIGRFDKRLDMIIYRERVKEEFTYNRRRHFPIRAIIAFDKKPLSNKDIYIVDEEGNSTRLKTDKKGNFVYFPLNGDEPHLKKEKKFKQELMVSEYILGNTIYKGTYAILFGVRHLPLTLRKGGHNIRLGIIIFGISTIITFLAVILLRKRIKI